MADGALTVDKEVFQPSNQICTHLIDKAENISGQICS